MGLRTLDDFRTDTQSALGDRGFENSKLDRWINWAYVELAGSLEHEELISTEQITTSGGTQEYSGPTSPLIVFLLRDTTNNLMLRWIPRAEFYRLDIQTAGDPIRWTREGADIKLYPTPNSVVSIDVVYQKSPDELSLTGDKTVIHPQWDFPIFLLSVQNGLLAVGEERRANAWFTRAVQYIQTQLSGEDRERFAAGVGATLPKISEAQEIAS